MIGTTEAARRLGVVPQTVCDAIRRGVFAGAVKLHHKWRIPEEALAAYHKSERGRSPQWATLSCRQCGREFNTERWRVTLLHRQFCSVVCRQAHYHAMTDFVCDFCGKTFRIHRSQRPKPLKFCDRECMKQYLRGRRLPGEGQTDTEPVGASIPTAPRLLVEYDPMRRTLRNKEPK